MAGSFRKMLTTIRKMRRVLELLEENDSTSASAAGLELRQKNRTEAIELMRELVGGVDKSKRS
jgi:hypothetical protein